MATRIKQCVKSTATVAIQLDGKHIRSTPNLLFERRLSENMVDGGRNEKCAVLTQKCGTQKCGDDRWVFGASSARTSAECIVAKHLKSKDRC